MESTSNRIGLLSGLPFIAKILSTAVLLNGSAPNPYDVSVGKAITLPFCSKDTISSYSGSCKVSTPNTFTRGLYYA